MEKCRDLEYDYNDSITLLRSKKPTKCRKRVKKINLYQNPSQTDNENDLLNISEKLTDNAYSIRRILRDDSSVRNTKCKRMQTPYDSQAEQQFGDDDRCSDGPSQPAYLSQFDPQTFDCDGDPSAPNDIYHSSDKSKLADLERNLSYQQGWSEYGQVKSMDYGVMPDRELVHNNMVPFFSLKQGYGSNDSQSESLMNYKNQLFSGNLRDTWKPKTEISPLFAPMKNLSHIQGAPVMSEDEISRYMPGRYHQGEKPFDDVKVTPGVNLQHNELGTHGFHTMYRNLPKTVDELRVKPKITHEGRIIEGMRGQARPLQAPVISYRPETFKTNTTNDLLPTSNVTEGPKTRDNFIMKETDRAHQHIEYTGGAYTSHDAVQRNVPEHMQAKHKYSTKLNYKLPKPLQKFSKVEAQFNPNLKSYDLPFTSRDQIINNERIGSAASSTGTSIYTNLTDAPRTTLKEIVAEQPSTHSMVAPNTMRGTVHPMDIANTTIKETTVVNPLNPNAPNLNTVQRVYLSDTAKTTMRETTAGEPVQPMNAGMNNNLYTNWTDIAKPTTKETTVGIPYQTMVTPVNQQQRAPDYQDSQKTTMREITVQTPWNNFVTPVNQQQRAPDHQDLQKTTMRETTVQTPWNNFVTPVNQQQRAPDYQDSQKTTMREITSQTPWNNFVTPVNQQQRAPNHQDLQKTTMREITVQTPHNNFVTPINQQQRAPDYQDLQKTTMRETTVQTPHNNFVTPVNQQQRAPDYQDSQKTTMKEITSQIPWNNFVTPVNQQQRAPDYQDLQKTTMRETTVQIPYNTTITAVGQFQRAPNPQDAARTTTKEQTVVIPYQSTLTAVGQYQRAPNPQDVARTTIKEQTVVIPYNTHTTGVNQQQGQASAFDRTPLRQTIKETTVDIARNNNVVAVNQAQPTLHPQDNLRTTTKEQTVQIPYNTHTTGVNRQQGQASTFDRTPLRSTTKETTIDNEYLGMAQGDISGRGYGYMAANPSASNTNKQFTCQEVYIGPLEGENRNRSYEDAYNAEINDRKEILQQYRAPTNSGVDMGPDPSMLTIQVRDDNNRAPGPIIGCTVNNQLDRLSRQSSIRPDSTIPEDRFIDPVLIQQLQTNPYNIPIQCAF